MWRIDAVQLVHETELGQGRRIDERAGSVVHWTRTVRWRIDVRWVFGHTRRRDTSRVNCNRHRQCWRRRDRDLRGGRVEQGLQVAEGILFRRHAYRGQNSTSRPERIGALEDAGKVDRSEEHTSELQSQSNL